VLTVTPPFSEPTPQVSLLRESDASPDGRKRYFINAKNFPGSSVQVAFVVSDAVTGTVLFVQAPTTAATPFVHIKTTLIACDETAAQRAAAKIAKAEIIEVHSGLRFTQNVFVGCKPGGGLS